MKKLLVGAMALMMCAASGCTAGEEVQTVTCLVEPEPKETTVYEQADMEQTAEAQAEQMLKPPAATEYVPVEAVYTPGEAADCFDAAFLKETLKKNKNFVISPVSVKLALNMASAGTGEGSVTENELLALFGYASKEEMLSHSKSLIDELDRDDESILIGDSIWLSDKNDGKISKNYINDTADAFSAELFVKDLTSEEFVSEANNWISDNTKGLIQDMLARPLDENARLMLVNTLYFKNDWKYQFWNEATRDEVFHGADGDTEVPAMHLNESFEYAESEDFRSVRMYYTDGSYMNIYLPADESKSIADIVNNKTAQELEAAMDMEYGFESVNIALPKFECEYKDSLVEALQLMGVSTAFDPNAADFGGMLSETADAPLYIADVIQAAKLICDEKGTEAAAATMVTMAAGAAISDPVIPIDFIVDRPFIYEIKSPSGETLFMGVMQNIG